MKILLTTTPFTFDQSYYLKFPDFPVLNLAVLASIVSDEHDVRIASNIDCVKTGHRLHESIKEFSPQVIGVSIPSALGGSSVFSFFPDLVRDYPDIRFVAGGQYASVAYQKLLNVGFSAVVMGPGEGSILSLLRAFENGSSLEFVTGIAYQRSDGEVVVNQSVSYDNPLDSNPFPARGLMTKNKSVYGFGQAAAIEVSRGCPFACRFCTVHGFWGRYHEKSNEQILEELKVLADSGTKELLFVDNSFGVNKEKTSRLADEMIRAKFDFVFGVFFRADTVARSAEMVEKLSRAGLRYAVLGFESYVQKELDWMRKKTTPAENRKASEILRKNGIVVVGSHMVFCPQSGIYDALVTFKEGLKYSDLFKVGTFAFLPDAPVEKEEQNGSLEKGPDCFDCVHVAGENSFKKKVHQLVFILLAVLAVLYPGQWLKMFSSNPVMASIVRREYKVYWLRVVLLVKKVFMR